MQTPRLGGQGVQVVQKFVRTESLALPLLSFKPEIGVSGDVDAWPLVRFKPEIF
jgi:hypothetical protein